MDRAYLDGEKTARIDTAELHNTLRGHNLSNRQVARRIGCKIEDLSRW